MSLRWTLYPLTDEEINHSHDPQQAALGHVLSRAGIQPWLQGHFQCVYHHWVIQFSYLREYLPITTIHERLIVYFKNTEFSSVQSLSHVWLFATPWTAAHQASLSFTISQSLLGDLMDSCPSNRWCHPTISSSVVPFSSCLQSFPAPGYFPMSQLFASGGQRIGVWLSASVLPMNI